VKLGALVVCVAVMACGGGNPSNNPGGDGGGGGDGSGTVDAPADTSSDGTVDTAPTPDGGTAGDAPGGGPCTPGGAQCANCADDDSDGRIDGFDPECSGPLDNDEATFATGIPGDNKDAINQDCFFDGDSGAGNDGCNQHVCCLLQATTTQQCAAALVGIVNNPQSEASKFDPATCFPPIGTATVPSQCQNVCGPLAPPGCDCFGCCTICDPATNQCYDIAINPATSPECTPQTLSDPTKCKTCGKVADCGAPCGGSTCILCPGQDPNDLPPECGGAPTCPDGTQACDANGNCPAGSYCSTGCCIGIIQ
jgi:hypothetical protein